MIHNLAHTALSVSDMDRSLKFYRDLLSMTVSMDMEVADDRIGRVIGIKDAKCRIVHLTLQDRMLELFQYYKPKGVNKIQHLRQCDIGFIHIGFDVSEIEVLIEKLKSNNVKLLGELVEFRPGVKVVYFRGPDGEICEFRELPQR